MLNLNRNAKLALSLLFVLITFASSPAQQSVYIDPTNKDDPSENGTLDHPYDSWNDVRFVNGRSYLQKCGTIDTIRAIEYNVDNLTFGSYGSGAKPKIFCQTKSGEHAFKGYSKDNITFRNLEIFTNGNGVSCIYFNANCTGGVVDSCILHSASWGIRITSGGNRNHLIQNTEIYDIKDDGIFVQDATDIEIANCYIHHVNQNWQPPNTPESSAAGDGIQFDRTTDWYVHHNLIDRSDSGNKFCIVANNENQDGCVLEHNVFIGPLKSQHGGACVYFGDGRNLIVRYNTFKETELTGLYYHAANVSIYGNVFDNLETAIYCGTTSGCEVYHNVFQEVNRAIIGNNIVVKNNIFDVDASKSSLLRVSKLEDSHNHFTFGDGGEHATSGDPLFVDPANGDFHLQPGSPCINAGTDVGIEMDAEGTAIPHGEAPDIGAYEFSDASALGEYSGGVPVGFSLSQNYPNPFNPNTTIVYTVPQLDLNGVRVTLNVYDLQGRFVCTLVDEQQNAGTFTAVFKSTELTSGIYFYQLSIWRDSLQLFSETKSCVFMK